MSWLNNVLSIFNSSLTCQQRASKNKKSRRRKNRRDRFYPNRFSKSKPFRRSHSFSNSSKANRSRGRQRGAPILAYHGTPSSENAKSIFNDGWLVGSGNAYGDGVYFAADPQTAKSYAGSNGLYLKCILKAKRICNWDSTIQSKYDAWCCKKKVVPNNSAKTAFLIQNGYDCVRSGNVIVMLAPQYANPTAWKRKNWKIRILSVHRSHDDKKIRV